MDAYGQSPPTDHSADPDSRAGRRRALLPLRGRDIQIYRLCDDLSGGLIYLMVIFSPWAFGTSETWSIWVMNYAGYALGLLLAVKLAIRWLKGYDAPTWDKEEHRPTDEHRPRLARLLTRLLACLTVAILAYCFISAVNARSTYLRTELRFDYHDFISWLPHSFDSSRTWFALAMYSGLACWFWAVRDWLIGKSLEEELAANRQTDPIRARPSSPLPARLRRLLWLLCVNGLVLGIEGIVQRLEGSGRLLFLVQPRVNPEAITQFGPYAYRANASQYFNLVWPVCLGFWWTLQRFGRGQGKLFHLLLVCGAVMAACPIISTSRGGAIVTVGIMVVAALFFIISHFWLSLWRGAGFKIELGTSAVLLIVAAVALGLGYYFGWKQLAPRLTSLAENWELREKMYEAALPMTRDYPVFGTGPGTFESVFQLYRPSLDTYWPAQLHNDWLETLITFGWVGSALIALAFFTVAVRWWARGGIFGGRRFVVPIWLAIGGCFAHARGDFPFQMHSIVFLFLLLCAILFNLSRHR